MDPITLKSGASLAVTVAPFTVARQLMKVVARELAGVEFNLDLTGFDQLSGQDINVFKNAVFKILQSDAVEAAMFECAKKCLYNNQSILPTTFEPEEARGDYLPVAWEVMKANLRPFFSGLDLSSWTSAQPNSNTQKSE